MGLLKPSIHDQIAQCLALDRLAALAWEMGEDKLSTALQLWDEQGLDPKGTYSRLPRQSCRRKMNFYCNQQALEENQLQDKKTR